MKNLLKKSDKSADLGVKASKGGQPTAKKPLFGKKSATTNHEASNKFPKKGFSLKNSAETTKATSQPVEARARNNKVLVIVAVVVLLVLAALAAKMFLFSTPAEEPVAPAPAVETTAPPTPDTQTADTQAAATQATDTQTTDTTTQVATGDNNAQATEPQAQQAQTGEAQTQTTASTANTTAQTTTEPQNTPAPTATPTNKQVSYEDFVREAKVRIYREHNTNPSTTNANQAAGNQTGNK